MKPPHEKGIGSIGPIPTPVNTVRLPRCTQSRDYTKRISHHIWADYMEEADH
ncbi:hypothetical protein J2S00_003686 [Caldalkalibacillus uzonensis]|uniref:Uncharacterized protein n=1 Tax=Caldalkalibacillus uzonensis TaxID=353224 RepID=A0ABU0CXF3_9BACI|nr:hypothetical protein [Caldalkalibacillus uzonensis]